MNTLPEIRKQLNHLSEGSGHEENTSALVCEILTGLGIKELHRGFSNHSVLAVVVGNRPGNSTLFRCELDAIPSGASSAHLCGHDGHIAIMLAFAQTISRDRNFPGKALLLFQSAEETGTGAADIIKSEILSKFKPDRGFALHNLPGYPEHSIICRKGIFSSSVVTPVISLIGKTAHAAEPHKGISPASALAQLIQFMQQLSSYESTEYFLSTPVWISMGERAFGTSAAQANAAFTVRAHSHELLSKKIQMIEQMLQGLEKKCKGLSISISLEEPFRAVENDSDCVSMIMQASETMKLQTIEPEVPFSWGEDFGEFAAQFPCAMFGLGAGLNCPPLHSSEYDFPDSLIETGSRMFEQILKGG